MANVTEISPPDAAETKNEAPESAPPATSAPPKPPNRGGRPPKASQRPPEGRQPQFFERVAAVSKEDWGQRAYMYVYVSEPVLNAKTFGDTKYLLKSSEPILDLETLKQDYGSFKGWMTLNTRKSGNQGTDEIDRYEFTIFDIKHPPKFPVKTWANDPKNERWKALLPPEKPAASEAASSLIEGAKFYRDVRQEVKDEMPEAAVPADHTKSTLETMKLAKELFAPPAAAAPAAVDPFDTAKKVMDMRANDPMITLLLSRMEAQDKAMEAQRQRQYDLEKELRDKATAPTQSKGLVDQLVELAALGDKLEPVKKLFGLPSAVDTISRTASAKPLDVVRDLGKEFFNSDLSRDIGRWLGSLAERNYQQNPAPNGTNGATQQPRQSINSDPFAKFIEDIVNPKLMMYFNGDPSRDGGEAFADVMYALFPEFFTRLQNFEHPRLPGLKGAAAIITGYKNTPHIWNQIGPTREVQFAEFVNGFCEWTRPADEPAEDADVVEPVNDAPIDFDAQFERETRPS